MKNSIIPGDSSLMCEQDKYYKVFNHSLDLILLIDGETGKIAEVNDYCRYLTGYAPEELTGRHYSVILNQFDDLENSADSEVKMFGSSILNRFIITRDGNEIPIDFTLNTIKCNNKNYIVMYIRDITERVLIEKENEVYKKKLEKLNATKDKFFTIISHDLKNLFSSLIGYSSILHDEFRELDEDDKEFFIDKITSISKNSHNLLENLLQWARTQTGSIDYAPKEVQICDIIDEVLELSQNVASKKHILIKLNCQFKGKIFADANMIKTVLRNLLSNAIKYSFNDSEIILNVEKKDKFVKISVADFGIGMDEETISGLFKIDTADSVPGTNEESGNGIGLILCKEFIDKNNGSINVHSTPNEGSTFSFSVPCAD